MRKIFYLTAFLMLSCIFANAQNEGQWYGHYKEDVPKGYLFGKEIPSVYRVAIFLPGKNSPLEGLNVDSIRFPMIAPNFTDVHVWISKGSSISEIDNRVLDIAVPDEDIVVATRTWNAVKIDKFAIPDEGMFVGFDFTIKDVEDLQNFDLKPVIATYESKVPRGSFYLKIDSDSYYDRWVTNTAYGTTPLQVFVDGHIAEESAFIENAAGVYGTTVAGKKGIVHVKLMNTGITTIQKVGIELATPNGIYTDSLSFWNDDYAERAIALGENPADYAYTTTLLSGDSSTFFVKFDAPMQVGTYEIAMRVVTINDDLPNALANNVYYMKVKNIDKEVPRTSVLETFSSNKTDWGGYTQVGHEKVKKEYGDRIIPIVIRDPVFTDDPITFSNYDSDRISVRGWPRSHIDSHGQLNPYHGWNYNGIIRTVGIANTFATVAEVSNLSADWVWDSSTQGGGYINVNSSAKFYIDEPENTYEMGYYLVADSVYKDDPAWYQDNMFAVYADFGYSFPEDLDEYSFGDSHMNIAYDNIAISSSWKRDYMTGKSENLSAPLEGEIRDGGVLNHNFKMMLPENEELLSAIKMDKLRIVALLLDKVSREVINAAEVPIDLATSISETLNSDLNGEKTYYNINGVRLNKPEKGVNIIRMSDGSVRKVVVK